MEKVKIHDERSEFCEVANALSQTDLGRKFLKLLEEKFLDHAIWQPSYSEHLVHFLEGQRQLVLFIKQSIEAHNKLTHAKEERELNAYGEK